MNDNGSSRYIIGITLKYYFISFVVDASRKLSLKNLYLRFYDSLQFARAESENYDPQKVSGFGPKWLKPPVKHSCDELLFISIISLGIWDIRYRS